MSADFAHLLILLVGVIILLENRLRRVVLLSGVQGALLLIPLLLNRSGELHGAHLWGLVALIIVFKAVFTPTVLMWSLRRLGLPENTGPRLGFLPTLLMVLGGLAAAGAALARVDVASVGLSRPALVYTLLVIFVGALTFIVRTMWVPLIVGFVVFENGIFLLTLQLGTNLPLGIELGAFVDTLLVLVAAATLQVWSRTHPGAEAPRLP